VLYPRWPYATLYLNRFRGEPAISGFDWPFTPYHSSSPSFSTDVGSVLQCMLLHLQPDHGKITRFRVWSLELVALFRLAFAAPTPIGLSLLERPTRWPIIQKVRRHPTSEEIRAPTACRHPVSGTVSLPSSGCFSPFPHGTGTLSVTEEYLGLEGGPPNFRQDFTCPALLEDVEELYPYGAVTRYGPTFQTVPVLSSTPLAWSAFARHYLRSLGWCPFLRVLRCFSSPGSPR